MAWRMAMATILMATLARAKPKNIVVIGPAVVVGYLQVLVLCFG